MKPLAHLVVEKVSAESLLFEMDEIKNIIHSWQTLLYPVSF